MSTPELSVVIPAYDEAERLPRTLAQVAACLARWGHPYEIVVVDDGSRDGTAERGREAGALVTVLRNDTNRGKGHAVRRGVLASRGSRILMTDADLSTPIDELPRLAARMDAGYDVVIASRALPGSNIEVRQPWYRENMGRLFNLAVRLLVVGGLRDTQCGFKLFAREPARAIFSACRLDGFCFDVEALFIARRRGYRVAEVPVTWRNDAASRVGNWKGFLAFLDLARIRGNDARGLYRL